MGSKTYRRMYPPISVVVIAAFLSFVSQDVASAEASSFSYLRSLQDVPNPPLVLGTAKQDARQSTTTNQGAIITPPTLTPPSTPNNVMTDQTIQEAVDIWCSNPTLAVKYYGPIAEWNTSAVTNFRGLFRRKKEFNDDISQWDTSQGTSMAAMFEEAHAFDQDLSQWDTSNVVSMSAMFADATSFTGTHNGNSMAHWNVEKVTRMDRMFQNAFLFQGNLSGWKTLKVHHVANMFHNAINYRGGQDLALWHTHEFRDLSAMFHHAIRFQGNVSRWNTSNALEMDDMFASAIAFDSDLSDWDTSQVVTMARMFHNATQFTGHGRKGGIKVWNVENVRNFYGMFEDTPAFDADISGWNPSQAHTMERMFYNASAFGKTLATTISETPATSQGAFRLVCWDLPNAQVKVQNMFCGSGVRFDPCCATLTQMETSCCNRFCYNTSTTCAHPEHNHDLANHYGASSGNLMHDDEYDHTMVNAEGHVRGNFESRETTSLGWEGIVMIVVLIVFIMLCFLGLVYCL